MTGSFLFSARPDISMGITQVLERVMLGDAWRSWFLVLACSGLAVVMGKLLLSMLVNDPALYLAATFIGSVAFLAFLGSTILFMGELLLSSLCAELFA